KGDVFPEGSGRLVKAGTKINFQFHLHSIGTETPTNVALGLKFYPKGYVPKHVISSTTVSVAEIDLRPNTDNVRSDGYLTLVKSAPRGSVGTTCPNRITKNRSKREKPHSGS